ARGPEGELGRVQGGQARGRNGEGGVGIFEGLPGPPEPASAVSGMTIPPVLDWDASRPPPQLALRPAGRRIAGGGSSGAVTSPFDFSAAMRTLCEDVVRQSALFGHVDLSRVLFTITRS